MDPASLRIYKGPLQGKAHEIEEHTILVEIFPDELVREVFELLQEGSSRKQARQICNIPHIIYMTTSLHVY